MAITKSQFRQLQALEQFTSGKHLLTKDLELKGKYSTFSPLKLIYFLFGTFSDRKVAISVHKLLSSKKVQEYLAQHSTQAENVQRNITLLDMKFSEKGNHILKKVKAAQMQIDPVTETTIQKNINFFGLIPPATQAQVTDCLNAVYPEMKITKQLGKGANGTVHLFEYVKEGQIERRVLKLSPWSSSQLDPNTYQMNQERLGGE